MALGGYKKHTIKSFVLLHVFRTKWGLLWWSWRLVPLLHTSDYLSEHSRLCLLILCKDSGKSIRKNKKASELKQWTAMKINPVLIESCAQIPFWICIWFSVRREFLICTIGLLFLIFFFIQLNWKREKQTWQRVVNYYEIGVISINVWLSRALCWPNALLS